MTQQNSWLSGYFLQIWMRIFFLSSNFIFLEIKFSIHDFYANVYHNIVKMKYNVNTFCLLNAGLNKIRQTSFKMRRSDFFNILVGAFAVRVWVVQVLSILNRKGFAQKSDQRRVSSFGHLPNGSFANEDQKN